MAEGLFQNDPVHPSRRRSDEADPSFDLKLIFQDKLNVGVLLIFFFGLLLLLVGAGMYFLGRSDTSDEIKIIGSEDKSNESQNKIVVHVDGAVKSPGVYELEHGSRVNDLIVKAGGLTDDANSAQINLAANISDGQKIYIAKIGEVASQSSAGSVAGDTSSGLINVNTATEAQLDTLPGVGPVTAQKIITSRPYSVLEELINKKAVGSATFDKIKDLITVY